MIKRFVNRYIISLKGEDYRIDPAVSDGYLVHLVMRRMWMKLRGVFSFPGRKNPPFIGKQVTLRAKKLLQFGAGLTIGDHCFIDALSADGIRLGRHVSLGTNSRIECTGSLHYLGKGLVVGDHVGLGTDNFFGCAGGIEIGADTIIGNFVGFHAENHVYENSSVPVRLQGTTHQGIRIGRNCWIGARVSVLDGAMVGDHCIIAAGAVLIAGTYADYGIYGGVPAKLIKYRKIG